ncbi:MAG TPA: type II toxin-antitoxin system RelE/ParE family toxin [Thermoanaerobaculia bacterium]|jgi:hypothetical protein
MAARAFELHEEAEKELDDAIAVIESARSDWGFRFLAAFDLAIVTIMEYPDIGRRAGRFRIFTMAEWPYKIVYTLERDLIFITAVAHHKRKPGYWRKRVH